LKLENLESSKRYLPRVQKLNEILLTDLKQLLPLCVDGTVLKNTGIVKSLMIICASLKTKSTDTTENSNKNNSNQGTDLFSVECANLAAELVKKWKNQIKSDNKRSTILNLKGGNVLKM